MGHDAKRGAAMNSGADDLRRCAIAECENEFRSPKIHSLFCPLCRSSIGRRAKRPAAALLMRRSNLLRYPDGRKDWRRARLRMEISELTFEAWVSGFADFLLRGRPCRLVQNRL
jgi:hypothetical protein